MTSVEPPARMAATPNNNNVDERGANDFIRNLIVGTNRWWSSFM